ALLRNVIFGLSAGIVVGYFTPLFDGSGRFQGWHDKVANALVLDARLSPAPTSVSAAPATTAIPAMPPMPADLGGPAIPGIPAPPSAPAHPGGFSAPTGFDAPAPAPAPAPTPAPAPVSGAFTVPETGSGAFAAPAPAPAPASESAPAAAPAPAMPVADEGSLIAFVPGVSQTRPPAPAIVTPAPAPLPDSPADETGFYLDPALDETLVQRPSTPSVPVTAPTPAPPFEPSASPVPPFAAPPVPPLPAAFEPAPSEPALFAPAPSAPVPSEPARGFVPDEDDDAELEETRISIPGHRLIFTWDDGTRVPVSRRTNFGRNPAPEDGAVIVPVRDETLSLSKTHFEAASEASGGWVLDRHSTNGMTIVRDGQRIACPAGQRVPVRLGDAIEIGDRIVTVGGYA
ncbi:MAG: FHA domain-containing protein, partial [Herbiconiux sp.]|nr:FHA domain-containing protein [Herbiconiux sp.]